MVRNLILEKPEIFMPVISLSPILKFTSNIMKETLILDSCVSSNSIKDKNYKCTRHVDTHLPTKDVNNIIDMVAILCLNEFNPLNGSTKIWLKSHKSGIAINRNPSFSKKYLNRYKNITAPQGSIAFMLGQTWHAIGKNIDNKDRWAIIMRYRRWWIKPSTDFTRCGEKIFNRLTAEQKVLLGFNSIVPKFNNKNRLKTLIKKNQIPKKYKMALNY
jgi:ectoine hydroxylase-related dioxygenase (phytanoyl-CoA dioxygenase family)